jgi:hypothetical protein
MAPLPLPTGGQCRARLWTGRRYATVLDQRVAAPKP